jgi:TRAP-type C4-dicarboxylate transport system substrate-binding protein
MRAVLLAGAGALSFAAPVAANEKWDMPTPYAANNYHTENIRQFIADIEQASAGNIRITLHPNATLFKAPEIKRAVQTGQAQLGETVLSGHANEDPLFGIDSVPYVATSYAESRKLWDVSRKSIEAKLLKQGIRVLYSVPWPPQSFFSTRAIESAADLKGLKFRSYNPITARVAELTGMQPVTIQLAELPQALATGTVHGLFTSSLAAHEMKLYEQVRYLYDIRAWLPKNIVFINEKLYQGLGKGMQAAIAKAAAQAEERGWRMAEEQTKSANARFAAEGVKVVESSASLQAEFKRAGETIIDEWVKKVGPEGAAVLDAMKK